MTIEDFKTIIETLEKDSGIDSAFEDNEASGYFEKTIKGFTFYFDYNIWVQSSEYLYAIDSMYLHDINEMENVSLSSKDYDKLEKIALKLIWMDFSDHETEHESEHAFNNGF